LGLGQKLGGPFMAFKNQIDSETHRKDGEKNPWVKEFRDHAEVKFPSAGEIA